MIEEHTKGFKKCYALIHTLTTLLLGVKARSCVKSYVH